MSDDERRDNELRADELRADEARADEVRADEVRNCGGRSPADQPKPSQDGAATSDFQWPPPADDLAAIHVVDARTLRRIQDDRPGERAGEIVVVRPQASHGLASPAPGGRRRGLARGGRARHPLVRRMVSGRPMVTMTATLSCLAVLTLLEMRAELVNESSRVRTETAQAAAAPASSAPEGVTQPLPLSSRPLAPSSTAIDTRSIETRSVVTRPVGTRSVEPRAIAPTRSLPRTRRIARLQRNQTSARVSASRSVSASAAAPAAAPERGARLRRPEPRPPLVRFAALMRKVPRAAAKPFTALWKAMRSERSERRATPPEARSADRPSRRAARG